MSAKDRITEAWYDGPPTLTVLYDNPRIQQMVLRIVTPRAVTVNDTNDKITAVYDSNEDLVAVTQALKLVLSTLTGESTSNRS